MSISENGPGISTSISISKSGSITVLMSSKNGPGISISIGIDLMLWEMFVSLDTNSYTSASAYVNPHMSLVKTRLVTRVQIGCPRE